MSNELIKPASGELNVNVWWSFYEEIEKFRKFSGISIKFSAFFFFVENSCFLWEALPSRAIYMKQAFPNQTKNESYDHNYVMCFCMQITWMENDNA